MESIRQTQKKYGFRAMMAAILMGLFLILAGYKPQARGLILGTVFSVINFVLMGELLPLRMGKSKRGAFGAALVSLFFRFGVMAIPLVAAVKYVRFDLLTTIVGLMMIQIVIFGKYFTEALGQKSSSSIKGKF